MISKKAINTENFKRNWIYTKSAREAWSVIIENYRVLYPYGSILLPAYIGWSPNEGSGIFDPVKRSGLKYYFYNLGLRLQIDFEHFKQQVLANKTSLVLLVHYFGFTDNNYKEIVHWLKNNNIFFVEDCAHALLTDFIGGKCGRAGDFSFYSLHKILPIMDGGLIINNKPMVNSKMCLTKFNISYDLYNIYIKRISNYKYLTSLLKVLEQDFTLLHDNIEDGFCPQTLPVIVENYNRDQLYKEMNLACFGLVSLYHTMISELNDFSCDAVTILSKKIINFPIHQDISFNDIDEMVNQLKKIIYA